MALLARSNADLLFSRAIFCKFDLLFGIWVSLDVNERRSGFVRLWRPPVRKLRGVYSDALCATFLFHEFIALGQSNTVLTDRGRSVS